LKLELQFFDDGVSDDGKKNGKKYHQKISSFFGHGNKMDNPIKDIFSKTRLALNTLKSNNTTKKY